MYRGRKSNRSRIGELHWSCSWSCYCCCCPYPEVLGSHTRTTRQYRNHTQIGYCSGCRYRNPGSLHWRRGRGRRYMIHTGLRSIRCSIWYLPRCSNKSRIRCCRADSCQWSLVAHSHCTYWQLSRRYHQLLGKIGGCSWDYWNQDQNRVRNRKHFYPSSSYKAGNPTPVPGYRWLGEKHTSPRSSTGLRSVRLWAYQTTVGCSLGNWVVLHTDRMRPDQTPRSSPFWLRASVGRKSSCSLYHRPGSLCLRSTLDNRRNTRRRSSQHTCQIRRCCRLRRKRTVCKGRTHKSRFHIH